MYCVCHCGMWNCYFLPNKKDSMELQHSLVPAITIISEVAHAVPVLAAVVAPTSWYMMRMFEAGRTPISGSTLVTVFTNVTLLLL